VTPEEIRKKLVERRVASKELDLKRRDFGDFAEFLRRSAVEELRYA
jgi:hypothetical protein